MKVQRQKRLTAARSDRTAHVDQQRVLGAEEQQERFTEPKDGRDNRRQERSDQTAHLSQQPIGCHASATRQVRLPVDFGPQLLGNLPRGNWAVRETSGSGDRDRSFGAYGRRLKGLA